MELFAGPELRYHPVALTSVYPCPPAAAATKPAPADATLPMGDVVAALEHAATRAKRLSSAAAADVSEAASAIASLRNAHRVIGSFLSQFERWRPPPGDGAAADAGDEPMRDDWAVGVEEAGEADASSDAGEAEEGVGECGMQSKRRRKRPVPLSWPAGRVADQEMAAAAEPVERRRSAMDLVFQFHG